MNDSSNLSNHSTDLRVGYQDRGHGRGDFGVLDASGRLIAEVRDAWIEVSPPDEYTPLPAAANAFLFAAAPDLHVACRDALTALQQMEHPDRLLLARLEAALAKARMPTADDAAIARNELKR